jgi:hypothetical protein
MQSTLTLDRDEPRNVVVARPQDPKEYGPVFIYNANRSVDANPNNCESRNTTPGPQTHSDAANAQTNHVRKAVPVKVSDHNRDRSHS